MYDDVNSSDHFVDICIALAFTDSTSVNIEVNIFNYSQMQVLI
jgi:hypothetical protein